MERLTVYLETSVISYLVSDMSSNLVVAGHQKTTREFWSESSKNYDLLVSALVIEEIQAGNVEQSAKRESSISGIPILQVNEEVRALGREFISRGIVPIKAENDAMHLSLSAINGVDVLLTWNCKHIANIQVERGIKRICEEFGYEPPFICTPLELMGEIKND